ncbi:phosphoadenosine phosphosulfate reductase family protein (plasmid) [Bacillus thuringiensis]|uniref:phosphoadenosine phosphosulfate reductase domain-containing protein n=1 Tax=Bacillus thuringiensis TaxID=1428 RepID=UPI003D7256D0
MFNLEMAIEDALFRIRREYKRTNGKIYLSFSGGKDSTILAELIKMADLPTKIPFVFADTRIELDATVRHVKNYPYDNIHILKPRKPFGQILKEYGKPAMGKTKSELMGTYQRNIDQPLSKARTRQLISGEAEKAGEKQGYRSQIALSIKQFHMLHPDLEYKVANMCCQYMKKFPFYDFAREHDMNGAFTGVRTAEGGQRALAYKSCVMLKSIGKGKNKRDYLMSMPIIDWTDEICEEFIKKYNVKLSDAYEVYGADRTGCIGCPFSRNLSKDLKILFDHEPLKYKASMKWLGDVYLDQGIECPWDEEYTKKLEERKKVNEKRRQEMIDKFSHTFNPNVRKVY